MLRNEHRRKPQGLADLLLPFALIEDGILLQYDGSLMAGWSFRGPDTISAAPAEMDALSHRFNSALRLGGGWMVSCDAIRSCAPGYPEEGAFPDRVTRLIDAERRQKFMREGAHFESEYFLTIAYLPPQERKSASKAGCLKELRRSPVLAPRQRRWSDSRARWNRSRTSSGICSLPSG